MISELRKLQLLIIYFNYSSIWILPPAMFMAVAMEIPLSTFGAIRFKTITSFIEYFPFPLFVVCLIVVLSILLLTAAYVHTSSRVLYETISRSRVKSKEMRRVIIGTRPFGIQVGIFLNIKKISICMCFILISNYIVTLLVTFPLEQIVRC